MMPDQFKLNYKKTQVMRKRKIKVIIEASKAGALVLVHCIFRRLQN